MLIILPQDPDTIFRYRYNAIVFISGDALLVQVGQGVDGDKSSPPTCI
jgi:hypothetical protein